MPALVRVFILLVILSTQRSVSPASLYNGLARRQSAENDTMTNSNMLWQHIPVIMPLAAVPRTRPQPGKTVSPILPAPIHNPIPVKEGSIVFPAEEVHTKGEEQMNDLDNSPAQLDMERQLEISDIVLVENPLDSMKVKENGLNCFKKWWFRRSADIYVNGNAITGIPIFLHEDTLRVINDAYSYFIPLHKVDYIRTNDGLGNMCGKKEEI